MFCMWRRLPPELVASANETLQLIRALLAFPNKEVRHGACPRGNQSPLSLRDRQLSSPRKSSHYVLLGNPGYTLAAVSRSTARYPALIRQCYQKFGHKDLPSSGG